jgi:hypothetical protein
MKRSVLILSLVTLGIPCWASADEWASTVDGVTAHFGVVPSTMAHEWLAPHGSVEHRTRTSAVSPIANYHFTLALFDAGTGNRIEQAEASARHTPDVSHDGIKKLEPMRISDTTTYGNFFALAGSETQHFTVTVRLPDSKAPITFRFNYDPNRTGAK